MRLAWLTSAWDEQAAVLLEVVSAAIARGELDAELVVVVSTRDPDGTPHARRIRELASRAQADFIVVNPHTHKASSPSHTEELTVGTEPWRNDYERDLVGRLTRYDVDIAVLAGYMWIAGSELLRHLRMVNLHPARPHGPPGTRKDVVLKVVARKDRSAGAMVHVVTDELDAGPAIAYVEFSLQESRWEDARQAGRSVFAAAIEHEIIRSEPGLLVEALKILSNRSFDTWPMAASEPVLVAVPQERSQPVGNGSQRGRQ